MAKVRNGLDLHRPVLCSEVGSEWEACAAAVVSS